MSAPRRWFVDTEREHEAQRAGLGNEALQTALRHLCKRGDRRATVWLPQVDDPIVVELDNVETWPTAAD